jgi:hypothetical protein
MSEIRATTISDLAGTGPATLTGQYAAKAWVNFNGKFAVAIRESANVASITDNGTGNYTLNFTAAMPDANYAVIGTPGPGGYNGGTVSAQSTDDERGTNTTSATQIRTLVDGSGTGTGAFDSSYVYVTITR